MTRTKTPSPVRAKALRRARGRLPGHWLLQGAKARFSELVRRVRSEGPQHVTVLGSVEGHRLVDPEAPPKNPKSATPEEAAAF